jgi:hypothetical protein
MTVLIACLTTGKGSWASVNELINSTDWEKIYLITNDFGKEKFTSPKNFEFVIINPDSSTNEIKNNVFNQLKGKIKETEVALNFCSGSGKEHMAVISAVLNLGLGVRLVDCKDCKMDVIF